MVSPKTKFLDWDTTAASNTDVGGIGILGTNAVNNFDDAIRTIMAQLRAGVDGEIVYASKSGNYSSVANDNNAFHRFTATATVTLVAAATLGSGWHYAVSAFGASTVVTIDPNGSETIGGVTTLIIRGGQTALIICDGTNFQVEIRGTAYATQSGGYTALLGDKGTTQRFTAAATLSLTAAATLGASWCITVIADGGDVTLDPNGSETINGQTTAVVASGSSATIICDGSNFFFVQKPEIWEAIGSISFSGVTTYNIVGLGGFVKLRLTGNYSPTVATSLVFRTSTNNGSSFDSGASDYGYQALTAAVSTVSTGGSNNSFGVLGVSNQDTGSSAQISAIFELFNAAQQLRVLTNSFSISGGGGVVATAGILRASTTPRNALQLLTVPAQTFSGKFLLEGVRG